MRTIGLSVVVALVACGDDGGRDTATTAATAGLTIGTLSAGTTPTAGEGTATTDGPTSGMATGSGEVGDPDTGGGPGGTLPKFDAGVVPDVGMPPPDTGCTKVDLLFVIDDSGSMADEQVTLVQSFPGFVSAMQTQLADTDSYHVGVVTSDAYPYNVGQCIVDGALVTQTGGLDASNAVCGPFASGFRWMDQTEPDLNGKFTCAGQVGTSGDGNERPMNTMLQAVGPGLAVNGGCNYGFIRPDALLVVVVITDEEDDHEIEACGMVAQPGSPGEPQDWYNGLVAAKGGVETNIVVLSLIGPVDQPCPALDKCSGGLAGAEMSPRLSQFTKMFTYGSVGQICAPSYQQFFSDAIGVIAGACMNFMPPG